MIAGVCVVGRLVVAGREQPWVRGPSVHPFETEHTQEASGLGHGYGSVDRPNPIPPKRSRTILHLTDDAWELLLPLACWLPAVSYVGCMDGAWK